MVRVITPSSIADYDGEFAEQPSASPLWSSGGLATMSKEYDDEFEDDDDADDDIDDADIDDDDDDDDDDFDEELDDDDDI